jgi:protein-disulfide isomerase
MKALSQNLIASLLCISLCWSNQVQAWIGGNPMGSVTLVILFDYACPHCHATAITLEKLLQREAELRVIYRPVAVLGSNLAARAVLAAAQQQKAQALHRWILTKGQMATASQILKAATKMGIDTNQLKYAMFSKSVSAELKSNTTILLDTSSTAVPVIMIGQSNARQVAFKHQGELSIQELETIIYQLTR